VVSGSGGNDTMQPHAVSSRDRVAIALFTIFMPVIAAKISASQIRKRVIRTLNHVPDSTPDAGSTHRTGPLLAAPRSTEVRNYSTLNISFNLLCL
jgi:hypothetical protein